VQILGRLVDGTRHLAAGLVLAGMASGFARSAPADPGSAAAAGPHAIGTRPGSEAEVCEFCHTPQGDGRNGPGWTVAEARPAGFGSQESGVGGGTFVASDGRSVACLVCHDGSQAADVAVSTPQFASGLGTLTGGDHPVGVELSGFRPPDAGPAVADNRLRRDEIGDEVRWWIDMESVPNGVRDKTDVILYTRGAGASARPFIECATCHDAHGKPGNMFLRTSTARSRLCLACHEL